jgi:ubiquinone/menaquinone biosynthesis C-methylase UbiE
MIDEELKLCLCVKCHGDQIEKVKGHWDQDAIVRDAVRCRSCGELYDVVWGVPFFAAYEEEDLLGLIEIAANCGKGTNSFAMTMHEFQSWDGILERYHLSGNKAAFIEALNEKEKYGPWLLNRYHEWLEAKALTHGIDIHGCRVLDVGAGLGFDSCRLVSAGGYVTSLEVSPVLARNGLMNLPQAQWIGGLAHILPFKDESFDFVFANATLHHLRDIPTSMAEMLRVLKPGGWMITTCDSFRADHIDEDIELSIFNENPSVLSGVNERIPKFNEFTETLDLYRDKINPLVFTHSLYQVFGESVFLRSWRYDEDKELLAKSSGSIALKVQLKEPLGIHPKTQKASLLRPAEFARWLDSERHALARLCRLLPDRYMDEPFPGKANSKFQLLNGWQKKEARLSYRQAYRRCRWIFRRNQEQKYLHLEVMAPYHGTSSPYTLTVSVDGEKSFSLHLIRGVWSRFWLPIEYIPHGMGFAVEVELEIQGKAFRDGIFRVRQFELRKAAMIPEFQLADIEGAGLAAICHFILVGRKEVTILFYPSQEQSSEVINFFRNHGIWVRAIVSKGQEVAFCFEEGVTVEGTYPDPRLKIHRNYQMDDDPDLIVAPTLEAASQVLEFLHQGKVGKSRFATYSNGTIEALGREHRRELSVKKWIAKKLFRDYAPSRKVIDLMGRVKLKRALKWIRDQFTG